MSEHVKKLRCVGEPCSTDEMVAEFAADHLERCEKLLARYYASHNDPKFGPCDCEICTAVREAREKGEIMPPIKFCVMCGAKFCGEELRCDSCNKIIAERMRQEAVENQMRANAPELHAALRASTELLRTIDHGKLSPYSQKIDNQIAANERLLRGGK